MASNSSRDQIGRKTRLQLATDKRRAQEQLEQEAKSKRQKEMFSPCQIVGPRDIQVKLEEDARSSSSVKEEPLEVDSALIQPHHSFVNSNLPKIKLEGDDGSFIVKVEETVELEESTLMELVQRSFELVC